MGALTAIRELVAKSASHLERLAKPRARFDQGSSGFNDFGSGPATDCDGLPYATRIRIPAFIPPQPYCVLASVLTLNEGDAIVGLWEAIEIGAAVGGGELLTTPPLEYFTQRVTDTWCFPDASTAWALTLENTTPGQGLSGPNDSESFVLNDAAAPAMLYQKATVPGVKNVPGYLALTAYTPPPMKGKLVMKHRDVRYPWGSLPQIRIPIYQATTARLYCFVRQTDPNFVGRRALTLTDATILGLRAEDNFVQAFLRTALYFGVYGNIIAERIDRR